VASANAYEKLNGSLGNFFGARVFKCQTRSEIAVGLSARTEI
jgi:hypothetical protein